MKKKTKTSNRGHLMLFEDVYWRALKIHAAEKGTTVSAIVRHLVERYLRRRQRRMP